MNAQRDCTDYLADIHDAADKAEQFVAGMGFGEFEADAKTQFAVIRALEIIGEAAKQIPDQVRQAYPDVPWREMAGMRDKMIHAYAAVDLAVVWRTTQTALRPLRVAVARILRERPHAPDRP